MMENTLPLIFGFYLKQEVTVADVIALLSLIAIAAGGIFALLQWKRNMSLKRADYVKELNEKIRTDADIAKAIYMFDYNEFWYSEEFHNGGEVEISIDQAFSFFSYICYLKKEKLISRKEFSFFKYEIQRILTDCQTQDYFYNIYHFSKKIGTPMPFEFLFEYAQENGMIDDAFWSVDSCKAKHSKYHHNLNF